MTPPSTPFDPVSDQDCDELPPIPAFMRADADDTPPPPTLDTPRAAPREHTPTPEEGDAATDAPADAAPQHPGGDVHATDGVGSGTASKPPSPRVRWKATPLAPGEAEEVVRECLTRAGLKKVVRRMVKIAQSGSARDAVVATRQLMILAGLEPLKGRPHGPASVVSTPIEMPVPNRPDEDSNSP